MKDYYQYRRMGFKLQHDVYQKTRKTIKCYGYFCSVVNGVDNKSESLTKEKDIDNRQAAERYIVAINQALREYVPEEYREAVLEHTAYGAEYDYLERRYSISISTLKRWTQCFTYGVAAELGENFND